MLKMTVGRSAVKLSHQDDAMTVAWDLDASLEGDELLEKLRRIVAFMDAQAGREALPGRTPGAALQAVREVFPAPAGDIDPGIRAVLPPHNGWAAQAQPEIPADRQADWEFMPKEGE
jgi:hypothetical protein